MQVYIKEDIDTALEAFKKANGFNSDSQAVNRALSLFFKLETTSDSTVTISDSLESEGLVTTSDYIEDKKDLQNQIDLLTHRYYEVLNVLKAVTISDSPNDEQPLATISDSTKVMQPQVTISDSQVTISDYVEDKQLPVTISDYVEDEQDEEPIQTVIQIEEDELLLTTSQYVEDEKPSKKNEVKKTQDSFVESLLAKIASIHLIPINELPEEDRIIKKGRGPAPGLKSKAVARMLRELLFLETNKTEIVRLLQARSCEISRALIVNVEDKKNPYDFD